MPNSSFKNFVQHLTEKAAIYTGRGRSNVSPTYYGTFPYAWGYGTTATGGYGANYTGRGGYKRGVTQPALNAGEVDAMFPPEADDLEELELDKMDIGDEDEEADEEYPMKKEELKKIVREVVQEELDLMEAYTGVDDDTGRGEPKGGSAAFEKSQEKVFDYDEDHKPEGLESLENYHMDEGLKKNDISLILEQDDDDDDESELSEESLEMLETEFPVEKWGPEQDDPEQGFRVDISGNTMIPEDTEVTITEWTDLQSATGEPPEHLEGRVLKTEAVVDLWSLLKGQEHRGVYSGDTGASLKELDEMLQAGKADKARDIIVNASLSYLSYAGGEESYVDEIGE